MPVSVVFRCDVCGCRAGPRDAAPTLAAPAARPAPRRVRRRRARPLADLARPRDLRPDALRLRRPPRRAEGARCARSTAPSARARGTRARTRGPAGAARTARGGSRAGCAELRALISGWRLCRAWRRGASERRARRGWVEPPRRESARLCIAEVLAGLASGRRAGGPSPPHPAAVDVRGATEPTSARVAQERRGLHPAAGGALDQRLGVQPAAVRVDVLGEPGADRGDVGAARAPRPAGRASRSSASHSCAAIRQPSA